MNITDFLIHKGLLTPPKLGGLIITLEDGRKFNLAELMEEYIQFNTPTHASTEAPGQKESGSEANTTTGTKEEAQDNTGSGGNVAAADTEKEEEKKE